MNISVDLSDIAELQPLAEVVRSVSTAAHGVAERWLIVGAKARELILEHIHGLNVARRTVDLDIGVMVASWNEFEALRKRLIEAGATPAPKFVHRLSLQNWQIDIVPFGGVEQEGVIAWPPGTDKEMTVLGFQEASTHALDVLLPGSVRAFVAPLPALLLMKIIAWDERHYQDNRDARDIRVLIDSYSRQWNEDRLYDEANDLLECFAFDNHRAAAALLGRDAAAIADRTTAARVMSILQREASGETILLAADMNGLAEENLELLRAVLRGFQDAALSRR